MSYNVQCQNVTPFSNIKCHNVTHFRNVKCPNCYPVKCHKLCSSIANVFLLIALDSWKLHSAFHKCKKTEQNARKMHEKWTKTGRRQSKSSAAPCPRAASRCREIDFRFVAADYRRLSQILTFGQINTMYIITWWLQWALKLWESVRFSCKTTGKL